MTDDRDLLSIQYEENGIVTVKELDKCILSKGSWTTVLFQYAEWDEKTGGYSKPKYALRRYQKIRDTFRLKAKFNISSADQAQKIVTCLQNWLAEGVDGSA